jgi:pimeloyl-ACP methyl ester carboxylesterase
VISAAAVFTDLLAPLLDDRDLLLVDQRGTGRSNALRCELYSADDPAASLRDFLPPAKPAFANNSCARARISRSTPTSTSHATSNRYGARSATSR